MALTRGGVAGYDEPQDYCTCAGPRGRRRRKQEGRPDRSGRPGDRKGVFADRRGKVERRSRARGAGRAHRVASLT